MIASLRALLEGAIDYAGTFPPASLGLEQSAGNYFRYRQEPEAWMLGRLVCPAGQLRELSALVEDRLPSAAQSQPGDSGWSIAAVFPSSETSAEWRTSLARHLQTVRDCALATWIDALEVRLPDELTRATTFGEFRVMFEPLLDEMAAAAPIGAVFVEPPAAPAVSAAAYAVRDNLIRWTVKGLGEYLKKKQLSAGKMAFKLRTGGTTAQACLSSVELAKAICTLREHGVCWKATAGLHQPMFHYDVDLGTYASGFVNLFSAAVLAEIHHLPELEVLSILEDENVARFQFAEQEFHWRGRSASAEQISLARRRSLLSFGSCSFDDPRNGLRALGWL